MTPIDSYQNQEYVILLDGIPKSIITIPSKILALPFLRTIIDSPHIAA